MFDCHLQSLLIHLLIVQNCSDHLLLDNLCIHVLLVSKRQPQDRNTVVDWLLKRLQEDKIEVLLLTFRLIMPTWDMNILTFWCARISCWGTQGDCNRDSLWSADWVWLLPGTSALTLTRIFPSRSLALFGRYKSEEFILLVYLINHHWQNKYTYDDKSFSCPSVHMFHSLKIRKVCRIVTDG